MTQEQKAKAYDKVFRTAQELYNNPASSQIGKDWICAIFPELKESEDEKIREVLVELVKCNERSGYFMINNITTSSMLAWLEKQGEHQKFANNIVEIWKDMRLDVYQQASGNRHEPNYSDDTTKMYSLNDIDEIIEKMSEQKPADKVEPNFKVKDWVVNNDNGAVFQVTEIRDDEYCLWPLDSEVEGYLRIIDVDKEYHLWSIQDAKQGDVLVASDGSIFILASVVDCACKYYAALETDGVVKFNEGLEHYWETSIAVHPATKEQRDTLGKSMADAGYEFDFEKKELNKIEQSHTDIIPEDFEKYVEHLLSLSDGEGHGSPAKVKEISLKLLKLAKIEQNPAWSE